MTEQTNTPPNESPNEQDIEEFQRKFDEFFKNLSEREKLQAASVVVNAAEEDGSEEAQQVGENQDMEPLSEEEIEEFADKLNGFHDGLPEGQHEILDSMVATAFVHEGSEGDEEDVQGNVWLWHRWINWNSPTFRNWQMYYGDWCQGQGGRLYRTGHWQNASGSREYYRYGCWR